MPYNYDKTCGAGKENETSRFPENESNRKYKSRQYTCNIVKNLNRKWLDTFRRRTDFDFMSLLRPAENVNRFSGQK